MLSYSPLQMRALNARLSSGCFRDPGQRAASCSVALHGTGPKIQMSKSKRIVIDGMTCQVGERPKSGYTVASLIERLSGFPPSAPIGFATAPGDNLEILSIYEATETDAVWVDLGEE